jgi:Kef-type K+ transport system membrane component KefB
VNAFTTRKPPEPGFGGSSWWVIGLVFPSVLVFCAIALVLGVAWKTWGIVGVVIAAVGVGIVARQLIRRAAAGGPA